MIICGLDASTSIVGWSFAEDEMILDAGFLNISKLKTKVPVCMDIKSPNRLTKLTITILCHGKMLKAHICSATEV